MLSARSRRILSIANKERHHILRDPYALTIAIIVPVFIVLVFGMVIDFDVRDVKISFLDQDQTSTSRELLKRFDSSGYFVLSKSVKGIDEAFLTLEEGKEKAYIHIPPQFEKRVLGGEVAQIQVVLDGADNSTAGVVLGYLGKLNGFLNNSVLEKRFPNLINERYIFNPQLQSSWFVVPGLSAIVLALISILLTSLTVSKEWENGSMELLLSTPVKPIEIILGKMLPYLLIGLFALFLVLVVAFFVFGIPFTGNFLVFLVASIIFLVSCLAQGMLISVIAKNQQLSMQISMITGLLPSLLLSGFIFPVENMPKFFYYFTSFLPARWYIQISRSIFLKSAGILDVVLPLVLLFLLAMLLVFLALKKFKPNLES